jgi:hypothetical protein
MSTLWKCCQRSIQFAKFFYLVVEFLKGQLSKIIDIEVSTVIILKLNFLEFEKMPLLDFYFYSDYIIDIINKNMQDQKGEPVFSPFNPL